MNKTLARSILRLANRAEQNPMVYYRPTPPQLAFLKDPSPIKLLRGGNQIGKTMVNVMELLYRCLGCHPYLKVDPPPVECWLITHSHDQSRTIQQKLYDMTPKHELHPDCVFIPGRGFRGLVPLVRFRNGSIIRIKTCNQGIGLESASVPFIAIDEPIEEKVWGGLAARVLRGGRGGSTGTIAMTMTPVGADVSYLRQMVDDGRISCHVGRLTVEDTTPMNCDPIMTQSQIDHISSAFLPLDRDARINGAWDVGVNPNELIFDVFTPEMISSQPVPSGGDYRFGIGIDHGTQPNSQVATLVAVDMRELEDPRVYVLGEYTGGGATAEHHCRGILDMLQRHHVDPAMVVWTGDGTHHSGRGATGHKMSNGLLMRGFERVLNLPPRGLPWTIRTTKKFSHSVYYSASRIYALMAKKHFWVRPECSQLIKSIQRWTMKRTQSQRSRDPAGHSIDALRYAILPIIDVRYTPPAKLRMF